MGRKSAQVVLNALHSATRQQLPPVGRARHAQHAQRPERASDGSRQQRQQRQKPAVLKHGELEYQLLANGDRWDAHLQPWQGPAFRCLQTAPRLRCSRLPPVFK